MRYKIAAFVALLIAAPLLAALARTPAAAQQGPDWQACRGSNFDAVISGCTRIIERGNREPARNRAIAHNQRGFAYGQTAQWDRALSDFDATIRLGVKQAAVYTNRGRAHSELRDYDNAIRDLDEAIRLDPRYGMAYAARGFAYMKKGENDRALRDYDESIRLDATNWSFYVNRGEVYGLKGDHDRSIRDLDEAIRRNPQSATAYDLRGRAHFAKGDTNRAISDYDESIRLSPGTASLFLYRAIFYMAKQDYDRAIRDFGEAIRLDPKLAVAYDQRAFARTEKGEWDQALRDSDEAIRLDPKNAVAYNNRAYAYNAKDDFDCAVPDLDEAIRLDPKYAPPYSNRGRAFRGKGEFDRAIRDLDEAIRLDPRLIHAYVHRALIHEQRGELARAKADFNSALTPAAKWVFEKDLQKTARERLAALYAVAHISPSPPPVKPEVPAVPPSASSQASGPLVALVIGNGKYRHATPLPNPTNDGRDITAALRDLGFKVIEGYDLDSAGMRAKISEFGSAMPGAAATLFFYAGHGIQVAGKNYLVPTDAKLERPSALGVEAIEVGTILADMESEKRTNLVFLDACRDNPLSRSLARSFGATRSGAVGQGLAQLNAGIGTLITFATSPDTVALDGTGRNSPFTEALLKHIRTPNLEIRTLLTRVRADVVQATGEKQIPWDHSSLLGEFYFKRGG